MPWSGGTFTRTNGVYSGAFVWNDDKTAGTKITAAHHDTHDEDLADGIDNCMAKDGTNAATANLDMGNFKLRNMANGIATTDAATVAQLCHYIQFRVVAPDVALATGTYLMSCRVPYGMTVSGVRAAVDVEQASGSTLTVDINRRSGGLLSSILATKITIDNGTFSSASAAIPPVVGVTSLSADMQLAVDIDQIGDGTAKGLTVTVLGRFSP